MHRALHCFFLQRKMQMGEPAEATRRGDPQIKVHVGVMDVLVHKF